MSFISRNPFTGEPIAEHPVHDAAEVERRLARVWSGWEAWSATDLPERCAFLARLADLLDARVDAYARMITAEMGKTFTEAQAEIRKASACARHYAETSASYLSVRAVDGTPGAIAFEPLGPVLGIMPWNLPFWQVLRFFIPAAAVGNTVLVKHAESVQTCAVALESLVRDAGAPDGLYVNLAVEKEALEPVIADRRIRAVTVTASVAAGRSVAALAGRYGKKVVLELGGSDPFLVFEDADLDRAIQAGIVSRYANNAQSCIAAKRFLVAEPMFDAFAAGFVEAARALRTGDPMDGATRLGPLARADLLETLERQVGAAVSQGGRVLTGGGRGAGPGYFFEPTVIAGLPHAAPVAAEEFFGPVALLFPFRDEAEAVALANATDFGLGAAVWTGDRERASRVAARLEVGAVFINDFARSDPRASFGGVKGSGFGRELGALGALELSNAKLIWNAA